MSYVTPFSYAYQMKMLDLSIDKTYAFSKEQQILLV
jgi:hypothetical protein